MSALGVAKKSFSSSRPTDFCTSLQKGVWKMMNLKSSRVKGRWMPAGRQRGAISIWWDGTGTPGVLPLTLLPLALCLPAVHSVAAVQRPQVALDGELPVHHRVLGGQIWLVEIIGVLHVGSPQAWGHRESQLSGSVGGSQLDGKHLQVLPAMPAPASASLPGLLHGAHRDVAGRDPGVRSTGQPPGLAEPVLLELSLSVRGWDMEACPPGTAPISCYPQGLMTPTSLQHQRGIGSHQHGDGTSTSRGPRVPRGVDGDVPTHHHSVATWGRTGGHRGCQRVRSSIPWPLCTPIPMLPGVTAKVGKKQW